MVCPDAYFFYFSIWQKPVPDNFSDIDCSADGSSAGFDANFFGAAMEESDAREDVVHDWLFPD
jgi:hypothetical protein